MRKALITLAVLLVAAAGYTYYRNPTGTQKVVSDISSFSNFNKLRTDTGALLTSLAAAAQPAAPEPSPTPSTPPPPPQPVAAAPPPVAPPPPVPAPPPVKFWSPPDVMPAQPNWTWTALDGTVYNNVVVTKITPDTVSFTYAMGVAHDVPIANLPPDLKKKLNYDPVAASAARQETRREEEHPYYSLTNLAEAQNVARQLHWPLAWMCTDLAALLVANPVPDSEADCAQRTISRLKSHAIIILVNGGGELSDLPPLILNQFFVLDEGPIPGGHHFYAPKTVLSDADITKTYGRITYTQLKASGDAAFTTGLAGVTAETTPAAPASPPAGSNAAPTSPAPMPSQAPAPLPTAQAATTEIKPWAPPDVIPAQPNWTWTTFDGTTYEDVVITKIEAGTVSITHSRGVAHVPINLLPRDIQKQLNYDPHALSQISALIDGRLVSADGTAAPTPPASVEYYAIYYSAQWCPPCHAFTPRLVKWYKAFKPTHPNFEIVFVSEDHNEAAMFDYMKEMAMPWPAVRFTALKHDGGGFQGSGIEKFANDGIPDLVLVDARGNVLADSYQNGTYVGPSVVVEAINKLIGGAAPVPLSRRETPANEHLISLR